MAHKHRGHVSKWFFLKQFLNRPRRVGAALPSSRKLAQRMVEKLGRSDDGIVIELGPGTGVFTSQILQSGVPPEKLILVELNPDFAEHLRRLFPDVKVVLGDASTLPDILATLKISKVKYIISGLPFRSFPIELRVRLTRAIANSLVPGGVTVQFTYAAVPPLPDDEARKMGLVGARVGRVLANFPPAVIWQYVKS